MIVDYLPAVKGLAKQQEMTQALESVPPKYRDYVEIDRQAKGEVGK